MLRASDGGGGAKDDQGDVCLGGELSVRGIMLHHAFVLNLLIHARARCAMA